ncbi:hypothetical protein G3570_00140 [Balneolaceae bacterium YR4-1]|uniref:HhH-GPD domain-containing protein n=1 Tax=Halalkalibaculum roseum TaxID=2709311 RepID=A0A6M1T3S7_9BACT|nr:hypothetical protein [Halalkalibaculum roseum]NGP75023.1 hypothetical protein [Halalkalibaculum roseum]
MSLDKIDQKTITFFQNEILDWFKKNGRSFPWRKENLGSYELIIAEVLLQRTRAETVSNKFYNFLEQFSSWKEIDEKETKELEEALRPFGLYRQKAKRLKMLADEMTDAENNLPIVREELEEIPLIGQYIASAIISYVHEKPAPLLDVNMARVLERFFGPRELADIRYDPYLQKLSKEIVDHSEHQKINWAILDFASLICRKRNPKCQECMLNDECHWFNNIKN